MRDSKEPLPNSTPTVADGPTCGPFVAKRAGNVADGPASGPSATPRPQDAIGQGQLETARNAECQRIHSPG